MDWETRKVLILGAGRQGAALARYLVQNGARVVVNDRGPAENFTQVQADLASFPIEWIFGEHPLRALEAVDLVCLSGGVPVDLPLVREALRQGIPLSNDSQLFLEAAPCQVVGITGSAGKSTTTALVGQIAVIVAGQTRAAHSQNGGWAFPRQAWVGGNLGTPLIGMLDQMQSEDLAVMELSSFQLELMTRSPQVAAILNLTPNHLDRHKTMAAYTAAKARILDFQDSHTAAVLGRDDPGAWSLAPRVRGRMFTFGLTDPGGNQEGTFLCGDAICYRRDGGEGQLVLLEDIHLPGEHNLLNVLAAGAIALAVGLPGQAVRDGVADFHSLPHRLEFVRTWGGADWYNDSIATAPERAMAALRVFDRPIILLAGGRDKDLPWEGFAELIRQRVEHLIIFGEAADKVQAAVGGQSTPSVVRCQNLRQAVEAAARMAQPGHVVLLSPGGTSFDEFRDFEDRGEHFKRWVMELS